MKTPLVALRPSSHPRYAYEVTAPASLTGTRIRRYFRSRRDAEAFRRDLLARVSRHGSLALSREEHLLVARYREHLTVAEMEEALRAAVDAKAARSVTVDEAVALLVERQESAHSAGVIGDLHLRDLTARGPKVAAAFRGVPLSALDRSSVQDWLDSLACAPRTRLNYLRLLRQVLSFARREALLPSSAPDPTAGVHVPPHRAAVLVVSPSDMERLLTAAAELRDDLTFWWLIFGGFAGLRTSEVERLDWSDLRPGERVLYVRPGKTPLAERWVDFTPPLTRIDWSLVPSEGLVLRGTHDRTRQVHRQRVYARAGVSVPANALRHSFGSYHLVEHGEPHRTALQMGHATPLMTFSAYRRAVTPAAAAAWWSLALPAAFTPAA